MQCTEKFTVVKIQQKNFDTFLIFAQNIGFRYTLEREHTVYNFPAKLRKIRIPLHTPVFLYKSGVQGGILFTVMFS